MTNEQTPVFIAGAGPVGMTLALELARHGVRSTLVEQSDTTTKHPKMDLTNGRSMELYRRLGIVDDLRAVGVSPSEALDVVWATSAAGHPIHRFAYPSPVAAREIARTNNDGTHTLEPSMRVSQVVLEPVLKRHVDASPLIDVRFGVAYEGHEQDASSVVVKTRQTNSGEIFETRAQFLCGCDGGGSKVRGDAKIEMEGQFAIANAYMVHFRSEAYHVLAKFGIAYHLQTALGTLIAQNGKDIWTLQTLADPDSDPDELLRNFVGADFEYEILVANPWTPHMVVASRYQDRRVFLAGDACHQVIPTGGYGMNTGVGDAIDLGWKLASVVNGWGGEAMLASYTDERRPIALQNRDAALRHAETRAAISDALGQLSDDKAPSEVAATQRMEAAKIIASYGNAENESWGIEYGYRYNSSPIIAADDTDLKAPDFDPLKCIATTAPGCRLPSLYLANGKALFDLLGAQFTLIVVGNVNIGEIDVAARRCGLPLLILKLDEELILKRLQMRLILVRPDQHIAWRGDTAPDWQKVIGKVTGTAP
jgi:2-polyprenyl-6-methoxyphenol hydroxylase-like FAD-dependent oxidoreductase